MKVSKEEARCLLASSIAMSGIYLGSPRRRDSLPESVQLKRIALAQLKRERKLNKKKVTKLEE